MGGAQMRTKEDARLLVGRAAVSEVLRLAAGVCQAPKALASILELFSAIRDYDEPSNDTPKLLVKMAPKRSREDESGTSVSKKHKKHGFQVGPANLPDGTYKRKGNT